MAQMLQMDTDREKMYKRMIRQREPHHGCKYHVCSVSVPLAGKWEGRWLKGVEWYGGMKGHMGSAAGMDVEWDWSTGSSCTRQRMSSLVMEMLLGLTDPFHYSFSYL